MSTPFYNKIDEENVEQLEKFKEMIKNQEIINVYIRATQYHDEYEQYVVYGLYEDFLCIILSEEMDHKKDFKTLVSFVGKEVQAQVVNVDLNTGLVFLSRKKAQEQIEPKLIEGLKAGKSYKGYITGFINFGAFVEIEGISSVLRNKDFANIFVRVSDVMKVGQEIEVKLSEYDEDTGRFTVEPVEKYHVETPFDINSFEKGQIWEGTVVSIVPGIGVFTNLTPGFDGLSDIPLDFEVEEGMKVRYRITNVFEDEQKVRGRIIGTI